MPQCYNRSIWKGRLFCSPQLAKGYRLAQPQRTTIFLHSPFKIWFQELTIVLLLQAKSLGRGADDNSGMVDPEASHEVKILHNNKTFGLDLLEIDSKTELPCNQVNVTCARNYLLKWIILQEFKATVLLTSNIAKTFTIHYTIMAKVRHQIILNLSKSKGSVISTQRVDVSLGQKNSLASWKRSGLLELDPKGEGERGYDGTTVFKLSSVDHQCIAFQIIYLLLLTLRSLWTTD